ncbi:MAG: AAA family ATPase [Verrucomicrobiota bacterium]
MDKPRPRWLQPLLARALSTLPVVVVTGARQTGKTTLAEVLTPGRRYLTLDDLGVLAQAERDPASLLAELPVTIDEVQRAPALLLAVKRRVDTARRPGRCC